MESDMNKYKLSVMIISVLGLSYASFSAVDRETLKIKPFVKDSKYCIECHKNDIAGLQSRLISPCDPMCLKCHTNMKSHHKTGMRMNGKIDKKFMLSSGKKLACVTCHNLKRQRFDKVSWKAQSLYEKMFKEKEKYSTYYLVIRNNKGALCKKCH